MSMLHNKVYPPIPPETQASVDFAAWLCVAQEKAEAVHYNDQQQILRALHDDQLALSEDYLWVRHPIRLRDYESLAAGVYRVSENQRGVITYYQAACGQVAHAELLWGKLQRLRQRCRQVFQRF